MVFLSVRAMAGNRLRPGCTAGAAGRGKGGPAAVADGQSCPGGQSKRRLAAMLHTSINILTRARPGGFDAIWSRALCLRCVPYARLDA